MGTVGFGDVVPVSHVGRFIIMLTAIWGTFIFTLVIVAFSVVFNLSPHQKKAMHHLLLTRKAASTITTALRYFNARKKSKTNNAVNPLYKEML
jgi:Ion channel